MQLWKHFSPHQPPPAQDPRLNSSSQSEKSPRRVRLGPLHQAPASCCSQQDACTQGRGQPSSPGSPQQLALSSSCFGTWRLHRTLSLELGEQADVERVPARATDNQPCSNRGVGGKEVGAASLSHSYIHTHRGGCEREGHQGALLPSLTCSGKPGEGPGLDHWSIRVHCHSWPNPDESGLSGLPGPNLVATDRQA